MSSWTDPTAGRASAIVMACPSAMSAASITTWPIAPWPAGEIQATDLYSTDAEIKQYSLRVLRDDLGYFPSYKCVWLYRSDLKSRWPKAFDALTRLDGRITSAEMAGMNARAKLDRVPEERVAADFLAQKLAIEVASHVRDDCRACAPPARRTPHAGGDLAVGRDRRVDSARCHRGADDPARTGHPDDHRADPDDPIAGACWCS